MRLSPEFLQHMASNPRAHYKNPQRVGTVVSITQEKISVRWDDIPWTYHYINHGCLEIVEEP